MSGNQKVFIIAEAGVNHNGVLDTALELVDAAVDAKADCVKFQTWKTENVVTKSCEKVSYQKRSGSSSEENQFDMLKKLELSFENFEMIKKYCDKKGILFLSTADELESAEFLDTIQDRFKIGSAELTDLPYLKDIARFQKPVLLSTGMGTFEEVEDALQVLTEAGLSREHLTLLHCNSAYPTPYKEVNLNAMVEMGKKYKVNIGYSDHTLGLDIVLAAVALGAKVIEKHFTLNREDEGPDHALSLEPHELKIFVQSIRNVEQALGDGEKKPSLSEKQNMALIRKSIVAKKAILKGDIFTIENLTVKRPGTGLKPSMWEQLLGKAATKNFKEDEMIEI